LDLFLSTKLQKKGDMPSSIDRYNDVAKEIQKLIEDSHNHNQGFRAIGSKWSMSAIAHQKDRMHFNAFMNIKMQILQSEIHSSSTYLAENLFFIQCGNQIKEISQYLENLGKSLKTSGQAMVKLLVVVFQPKFMDLRLT